MVILLGGSGYVGQAFQRLFGQLGVPYRNLARRELDYTETSRLADLLAGAKAEFVINAAGYTGKPNVDACELEKGACLFGNAVLPGRIREACERTGTPWGHISSGCIFTGERHWTRRRLQGGRHAELLVPHQPLQLLQRHQGAGRGGARRRA